MDRRQPPLVVVGREDLALVLHHCRQRQRLAAGTRAEIDHLLAGLGAAEQRSELRALVLNFHQTFKKRRFGMDGRALCVRSESDAQAPRRPGRRLGREVGKRPAPPRARPLIVLTRRSSGAREASAAPSSARVVAEALREMRVEPFRIIAGDMRRRAVEIAGFEPRALVVASAAQAHIASHPPACAMASGVEPALALEHAEQDRARVSSPIRNALEARRRSAS